MQQQHALLNEDQLGWLINTKDSKDQSAIILDRLLLNTGAMVQQQGIKETIEQSNGQQLNQSTIRNNNNNISSSLNTSIISPTNSFKDGYSAGIINWSSSNSPSPCQQGKLLNTQELDQPKEWIEFEEFQTDKNTQNDRQSYKEEFYFKSEKKNIKDNQEQQQQQEQLAKTVANLRESLSQQQTENAQLHSTIQSLQEQILLSEETRKKEQITSSTKISNLLEEVSLLKAEMSSMQAVYLSKIQEQTYLVQTLTAKLAAKGEGRKCLSKQQTDSECCSQTTTNVSSSLGHRSQAPTVLSSTFEHTKLSFELDQIRKELKLSPFASRAFSEEHASNSKLQVSKSNSNCSNISHNNSSSNQQNNQIVQNQHIQQQQQQQQQTTWNQQVNNRTFEDKINNNKENKVDQDSTLLGSLQEQKQNAKGQYQQQQQPTLLDINSQENTIISNSIPLLNTNHLHLQQTNDEYNNKLEPAEILSPDFWWQKVTTKGSKPCESKPPASSSSQNSFDPPFTQCSSSFEPLTPQSASVMTCKSSTQCNNYRNNGFQISNNNNILPKHRIKTTQEGDATKKKLLSLSNPRSTSDIGNNAILVTTAVGGGCSPHKKTASRSTHHANGSNSHLIFSNSNHKSNIANHLNNALTQHHNNHNNTNNNINQYNQQQQQQSNSICSKTSKRDTNKTSTSVGGNTSYVKMNNFIRELQLHNGNDGDVVKQNGGQAQLQHSRVISNGSNFNNITDKGESQNIKIDSKSFIKQENNNNNNQKPKRTSSIIGGHNSSGGGITLQQQINNQQVLNQSQQQQSTQQVLASQLFSQRNTNTENQQYQQQNIHPKGTLSSQQQPQHYPLEFLQKDTHNTNITQQTQSPFIPSHKQPSVRLSQTAKIPNYAIASNLLGQSNTTKASDGLSSCMQQEHLMLTQQVAHHSSQSIPSTSNNINNLQLQYQQNTKKPLQISGQYQQQHNTKVQMMNISPIGQQQMLPLENSNIKRRKNDYLSKTLQLQPGELTNIMSNNNNTSNDKSTSLLSATTTLNMQQLPSYQRASSHSSHHERQGSYNQHDESLLLLDGQLSPLDSVDIQLEDLRILTSQIQEVLELSNNNCKGISDKEIINRQRNNQDQNNNTSNSGQQQQYQQLMLKQSLTEGYNNNNNKMNNSAKENNNKINNQTSDTCPASTWVQQQQQGSTGIRQNDYQQQQTHNNSAKRTRRISELDDTQQQLISQQQQQQQQRSRPPKNAQILPAVSHNCTNITNNNNTTTGNSYVSQILQQQQVIQPLLRGGSLKKDKDERNRELINNNNNNNNNNDKMIVKGDIINNNSKQMNHQQQFESKSIRMHLSLLAPEETIPQTAATMSSYNFSNTHQQTAYSINSKKANH